MMANGSAMLIGGAMALVHSAFVESWTPTPVSNWAGFSQGVAAIILVSNLVCYNMYGWLLKRFTATFLSFSGLVSPLFAAFYGWMLHGETVHPSFFLSVGILCSGLWLVYFEELRLGYLGKAKPQAAQSISQIG
jgi:drug/metabolite transporter (DMT)-like permease